MKYFYWLHTILEYQSYCFPFHLKNDNHCSKTILCNQLSIFFHSLHESFIFIIIWEFLWFCFRMNFCSIGFLIEIIKRFEEGNFKSACCPSIRIADQLEFSCEFSFKFIFELYAVWPISSATTIVNKHVCLRIFLVTE